MTVPPATKAGREPRHQRRPSGTAAGRRRPPTVSGSVPSRSGNDFAREHARSRGGQRRGWWLRSANSSCRSRLIAESRGDVLGRHPHVRVAVDSAAQTGPGERSRGSPSSALLARSGAVLMLSTPPAKYNRYRRPPPAGTASTIASRPEPHCRSTVMPGTLTGSPACSAANRATLPPPPTALPMTTSVTAQAAGPPPSQARRQYRGQKPVRRQLLQRPVGTADGVRSAAMTTGWRIVDPAGWAGAVPWACRYKDCRIRPGSAKAATRGSLVSIQSSRSCRLTLPRSVMGSSDNAKYCSGHLSRVRSPSRPGLSWVAVIPPWAERRRPPPAGRGRRRPARQRRQPRHPAPRPGRARPHAGRRSCRR